MVNGVWSGWSYQHYSPRSKQCTEATIYTNTHRNKTVFFTWSIKLNIFLVLVLPTKSVFKHKKHAVYNIHILVWGSFARGTPGKLPIVPMH
jgi:hypothetical protein